MEMEDVKKLEAKGATVTLPNDYFLNKVYVTTEILKKMNPLLMFLDPASFEFPRVKAQSRSFVYFEDKYSDASDPMKRTARRRTSIGEFASVEISPIVQKTGQLEAFGFEIAFDEDVLLFEDKIDDLVRGRNRVAYWLAEQRNKNHGDALVQQEWGPNATFTDDPLSGPRVVTAATPWTAAGPDPVVDILNARKTMEEQPGYSYRITDMFMNTADYYQLVKYLVNKTQTVWQKDPFGVFEIPTLAGISFHQVKTPAFVLKDSVGDAALALDRGNPAATLYQAVNPQYAVGDEIQSHVYQDNATHKLHYQFWFMEKAAVKEPLAVLVLKNLG